MEERMGDAFGGTEQLTVIRGARADQSADSCLGDRDRRDKSAPTGGCLQIVHLPSHFRFFEIREWHLLQRSVVVIDRTDRIVYVEYITDQMSEPDYTAAIHAVQRAAEQ